MSEDTYRTESVDFFRLRWLIQPGPMSQRIHVIEDAEDANSPQTPFVNDLGEFHPISELPFTIPPISRHIVRIDQMDGYKNWNTADDSDYDDDSEEEEEEAELDEYGRSAKDEVQDPINPNPDKALPDGWKGPYLLLRSETGFITIGDYVRAVHPWLVHLRPRYLREYSRLFEIDFEPDTDLWYDVRMARYLILANDQMDNVQECFEKFAQRARDQNRVFESERSAELSVLENTEDATRESIS